MERQKLNSILESFYDYFSGYVDLGFSTWDNLASEIECYLLGGETTDTTTQEERSLELQERLKSLLVSHPYPVCPLYERQISKWILDQITSVYPRSKINTYFLDILRASEDVKKPCEYVFKR